jgi:hypothetical protein
MYLCASGEIPDLYKKANFLITLVLCLGENKTIWLIGLESSLYSATVVRFVAACCNYS